MSNSAPKANKGEWSELYAFFKLLVNHKIPAAGPDLKPIPGEEYNFLNIIREEIPGQVYQYNLQQDGLVRILDEDGNEVKTVSTDGLNDKAEAILQAIAQATSSTFEMPSLSSLMDEYLITKVKANSRIKTDLLAVVADHVHETNRQTGFSIKSYVGSLPTLINPSGHTNFIYEVDGFNGDIEEVNAINQNPGKVQRRIAAIREQGGEFKYVGMSSQVFNKNLRFTDTLLPEIMAGMMLEYYSGSGSKWSDLVKVVAAKDSELAEDELQYKLEGFLRSAALGMVPATEWNRKLTTYGGFIVVLEDGRLVCYHLNNDDEFKEYMFTHTKLDTPSTTRFGFGGLYQKEDKLLFNLNMQVRFTK